jgi:hypothetical protein
MSMQLPPLLRGVAVLLALWLGMSIGYSIERYIEAQIRLREARSRMKP